MGNIIYVKNTFKEQFSKRLPNIMDITKKSKNHTTRNHQPFVPKSTWIPNSMDPELADSLSKFAVSFCNERGKDGSSVCSPLSAQSVLALTALGCAGASRDELLAAMGFSDDKAIRSLFTYLTSTLESVEGVTLRIANKVYVTRNGTLKPAIQNDAEKVFKSGLEQLDFRESKAAAAAINEWVEEQTAGMIKEVVSPGSLDADTGLLLVNAIYFQGLWECPFSEELTENRAFHVNDTTEIQVPMMYETDNYFHYKHSSKLRAKILRMNYEGRQASLVIVLPDEVEGLGDVMQQLAAGHDLMDQIGKLWETRLDVMIPKFKVETDIDLKQLLSKMGIKSIFDKSTSDIRMLTSDQRLYVSQAVQKAVIEVDEAGTKAAAFSYMDVELCSANWSPPEKLEFIADRPFLFVLTARDIPLFLGTYQGKEFAVTDSKGTLRSRHGNDHVMHRPCSADYRPPKRRKFTANRPFLYVLTSRQVPIFLGIYDGSEFRAPDT